MPELSPAFFFVLRKKLREGCTLTPTILFELRKKLREGCMLYFGNFVCNKKKVKKMLLPGSAFLFVSNSDKR